MRGSAVQFWCKNQDYLISEDCVICLADLAEGHVFNCPYENNTDRLSQKYPCSNYLPVEVQS